MKKYLLHIFTLILLFIFIVPRVNAACITVLNCNTEISPPNPNIVVKEFPDHCGVFIPKIINNGNSEILLTKFSFQNREYFLESFHLWSNGDIQYFLSNTSHSQISDNTGQSYDIDEISVTIPPRSEIEIWFPNEDITITENSKTDIFVLSGPSIHISGNIVKDINKFQCETSTKDYLFYISIISGILSITFLILGIFIKKERIIFLLISALFSSILFLSLIL